MLLATQEVMANQNRFRDLSMEYAQLEPVVAVWAKWQQAGQSIEEARALLKNQDADIEQLLFKDFFLGFHYCRRTDLLSIEGGTSCEQN